jgi:hypothetical protein
LLRLFRLFRLFVSTYLTFCHDIFSPIGGREMRPLRLEVWTHSKELFRSIWISCVVFRGAPVQLLIAYRRTFRFMLRCPANGQGFHACSVPRVR